jgi:hypothetical protein
MWASKLPAPKASTTTKGYFGLVTWYDAHWYFSVGPYPFARASMADVEIVTCGKEAATPDAWTFPGGFVPALSGTAVGCWAGRPGSLR